MFNIESSCFIIFTLFQIEIMFEKYKFQGVFIQIQAVLTLYAQGEYKNESFLIIWRLRF